MMVHAMKSSRLNLCVLLAALSGAVAPAKSANSAVARGKDAILGFLGRVDAAEGAYWALLQEVQEAAARIPVQLHVVASNCTNELVQKVADARAAHIDAAVLYAGHSMDGGAAVVQDLALNQSGIAGVILISGFLRRSWRPSVAECQQRWTTQPKRNCPKGKGLPFCLGGYLPDGVHNCSGPEVPAPAYPLPTLTIGGGLDGVVRVARIAEAWYTQPNTAEHAVAVLEGMNHGDLMSEVPKAVTSIDLASEIGAKAARVAVANLVASFIEAPGKFQPTSQTEFFAPFVEMFVKQEGSWWWTSNSEERGTSLWAAGAQQRMASPMPEGFDSWRTSNEFHMLSDEEGIPPYYRSMHRPNVTVAVDGRTLVGTSVSQLRYIKVSVEEAVAGLNGWAIIREEKAGILSQRNYVDNGLEPVAAIEIGTKLASRQLAHSRIGGEAPASLDEGNRCKAINEAAYDFALAAASPRAQSRYLDRGRQLFMGPDVEPLPPAGPWWIWNYLQFHDRGKSGVEVQSLYTFYPLTGPAYGAGNHYCKLLSPARVLEWIYTDSLRPSSKHGVAFTWELW